MLRDEIILNYKGLLPSVADSKTGMLFDFGYASSHRRYKLTALFPINNTDSIYPDTVEGFLFLIDSPRQIDIVPKERNFRVFLTNNWDYHVKQTPIAGPLPEFRDQPQSVYEKFYYYDALDNSPYPYTYAPNIENLDSGKVLYYDFDIHKWRVDQSMSGANVGVFRSKTWIIHKSPVGASTQSQSYNPPILPAVSLTFPNALNADPGLLLTNGVARWDATTSVWKSSLAQPGAAVKMYNSSLDLKVYTFDKVWSETDIDPLAQTLIELQADTNFMIDHALDEFIDWTYYPELYDELLPYISAEDLNNFVRAMKYNLSKSQVVINQSGPRTPPPQRRLSSFKIGKR